MPEPQYFRGYARDIGVSPAIGGNDNVQDALAGITSVTLGNFSTDVVSADAPTALTGDGAGHDVSCLIAAPPAWMDNAGNIAAAGLYELVWTVTATAGPTTPAQAIAVARGFALSELISCDLLGAAGVQAVRCTGALAVADVPTLVRAQFTMPTDVTEAVSIIATVSRLAY